MLSAPLAGGDPGTGPVCGSYRVTAGPAPSFHLVLTSPVVGEFTENNIHLAAHESVDLEFCSEYPYDPDFFMDRLEKMDVFSSWDGYDPTLASFSADAASGTQTSYATAEQTRGLGGVHVPPAINFAFLVALTFAGVVLLLTARQRSAFYAKQQQQQQYTGEALTAPLLGPGTYDGGDHVYAAGPSSSTAVVQQGIYCDPASLLGIAETRVGYPVASLGPGVFLPSNLDRRAVHGQDGQLPSTSAAVDPGTAGPELKSPHVDADQHVDGDCAAARKAQAPAPMSDGIVVAIDPSPSPTSSRAAPPADDEEKGLKA